MTTTNVPGHKRTKIVATLGPACDRDDVLRRMVDAGLNVVRINFSHGRHDTLAASVERIRHVAAEANVPLAILGDLRGPRIRVGEMTGGAITLADGADLALDPDLSTPRHPRTGRRDVPPPRR